MTTSKIADIARLAASHVANAAAEELYLKTGADFTRPVAIYGVVNERCNYKCLYCEYWRLPKYADEMSIAEWHSALSSLKDFLGKYHIEFSGGEPFIKPRFIEIPEFCDRNGIEWGVTTNGSAFGSDAVVRRTVAARPFNVNISVDSHEAGVHDRSRGIDGSHARLTAGIRRLMDERARSGAKFPIILKPVVHALNFRHLPDIVAWAKDLGATAVNFQPVEEWTPETKTDLWIGPDLQPELEEAAHRLIELKRSGEPILNSEVSLRAWTAHFRGEKAPASTLPCRVGMRNFFLRPDGDVQLCWSFPAIGNIRRASAESIWRGQQARSRRAETVACEKLCLFTCLSQKTLADKASMGMRLLTGKRG